MLMWLVGVAAHGQSSGSDKTDNIHGTVVNSVTREPIGRALVSSYDGRFATMTDSQGHFEFTTPERAGDDNNSNVPPNGRGNLPIRPLMLGARKPGFLTDENNFEVGRQLASGAREITIPLTPEALIVGMVTVPSSEAAESISVQLYRRRVQEGLARWDQVGGAQSKSDGDFRFADLPAGSYRLLTQELLDRDPITLEPGAQLYGYPPAYFPTAPDFEDAGVIDVTAGQTAQANLLVAKKPYHRVKIGIANVLPGMGIQVEVYAAGHKGPGFSLGYNNAQQTIEGLLPDGTYTVEATSAGPAVTVGKMSLTVRGAAAEGTRMALVPASSIRVQVKEEFTSTDGTSDTTITRNGRSNAPRGPRRYLNVVLEPADDFGRRGWVQASDERTADGSIAFDDVIPGRYWVRVNSSRGYAASVSSGNVDLLHHPLVVSFGGSTSPIEITMRDDTAEISGTVEGIKPVAAQLDSGAGNGGMTSGYPMAVPEAPAHVYCVPLADSAGQFTEIGVGPDGSFTSPPLPPGAYRLLAFDRAQPELEYRNPEAMRAYDSKGPAVRVAGGQKEHVQLTLISSSEQ